VFDDIDSLERRAAATRQGIMRKLACCEDILKEKERSLSRQNSELDSYKSFSGLVPRHLYCRTLEMMGHVMRVQLNRTCLLHKLPCVCHFIFFVNFS
jgi:hypothetical protein